jgi:HEAT repeat protein
MTPQARFLAAACSLIPLAGCSLAPKNFQAINHPAPIVRARAVSLSNRARAEVAIPALIQKLDDPDPVVRMAAYNELKQKTGQDFGFVAWADAAERRPAIDQYKAWWASNSNVRMVRDNQLRRAGRRVARW